MFALCAGLILFVAGLLASASPSSAAVPDGFVAASGDHFVVQDGGTQAPWKPIGYNQYRLTSAPGGYVCDGGYGGIDDARLGQLLDQVKASGANTVRTWFFQSYYDADGTGPGAGSFSAFDRVVNAAAARGLKVVPVLTK
jgi:hypothetical protein